MKLASSIILVFFSLVPAALYSSPVLRVSQNQEKIDLSPYLEILEDPQDSIHLEEILSGKYENRFLAGKKTAPTYGFTSSSYWVRFHIHADTTDRFILEFDDPLVDYMELYTPVPNGWKMEKGGDFTPLSERPLKDPKSIFSLNFREGETKTFYLYIRKGFVNIPLNIYGEEAFKENAEETHLLYGITYGTIMALAFYNFILFLGSLDAAFLAYSLYHFTSVFIYLIINGMAMRYMWPEWPIFGNYSLMVFSQLVEAFILYFARSYMNFKNTQPRLDVLIRFLIVFCLMLIPVFMLLEINVAAIAANIVIIIVVLPLVFGVFRGLLRKQRAARFFLLGWSLFLLGAITHALKSFAFLPVNFFTVYAMQIGSALEAVLMSVALADRMAILRMKEEKAIEKALVAEKRLTNELESIITKRTEDLREKNRDLEEANKTRDTFFSILAHDLRGPIGNLSVLFAEIAEKRLDLSDKLIQQFRSSTKSIYELLEDLLTWARSQKGGIEWKKIDFNLIGLIHRSVSIANVAASQKNIRLNFPEKGRAVYVFADPSAVGTVIRNLLSNAVKFTPGGGIISVSFTEEENRIKVSVSDTGIGISTERREKLFLPGMKNFSSAGTNNEKGTGLGLILCREFILANGGEIGVESEPNNGSTFWFTLPVGKVVSGTFEFEFEMKASFPDLRILIVEDNYLNLQTSLLALDRLAISCDTSSDGEQAVRMASENNYDLILIDVDLPKQNGVEASFEILSRKPDQSILALTSYDRTELEGRFESLPFHSVLNKPLNISKLVPFLERISRGENLDSLYHEHKSKKILIIDDQKEIHLLIQAFLRNQSLAFAESGVEALQKLKNSNFDLILCDLELMDTDGFALLLDIQKFFKEKMTACPPVYAVTAHDSPEVKEKIIKAGFDGIIRKPFTRVDLEKVCSY